jgi:hypothetical protein
MNEFEEFILTRPAWQLFIFLLPALMYIDSDRFDWHYMNAIGIALIISWYYLVASNLFEKISDKVNSSLMSLRLALCIALTSLSGTILIHSLGENGMISTATSSNIQFMIGFAFVPSFFYMVYFTGRMLATVLNRRLVSPGELIQYGFAFVALPIGLWIVQPIIRKIFSDSIE